MTSQTEENYLKAIFKLSEKSEDNISTNAIAAEINTAAASVTDMLKKLAEKKLVIYEKYKGVKLSPAGSLIARKLVRRHRLWEVFLVEKLGFQWDEVHNIAEELEHIQSDELTLRLDEFLGNPAFDPHGDPIPDKDGNINYHEDVNLTELGENERGVVIAVNDHSSPFLRFLDRVGLVLNTEVRVLETEEYDGSMVLQLPGSASLSVSVKVCQNLIVRRIKSPKN